MELQDKTGKPRKYNIDNIRAILIILVVLGHLLETVDFPFKAFIYCGIYVFHMPAFVFISGMCHKKMKGEKLLSKYLIPYLVFQVIYIQFDTKIIGEEFSMQFSMPYWILWYLVALICWNVFTEALYFKNERRMCAMLIGLIVIALLAGFDDSIGFYLSISRTIVFFPFYYAGALMTRLSDKGIISAEDENRLGRKVLALFLVGCCIVVVFAKRSFIDIIWLQSTTSYVNGNYNILIRGIIFVGAAIWIFFLLEWVKNRKVPILTRIGQNTYIIFILHGFIIKILSLIQWNNYLKVPFLACIAATIIVVLGLGYLSELLNKIIKMERKIRR